MPSSDRDTLEKARHHLACLVWFEKPPERWHEPVQSVIDLIDAHLKKSDAPPSARERKALSWRSVFWIFFYGWIAAGYTYLANVEGMTGVFEAVGFTAVVAVVVAVLYALITVVWNVVEKEQR